MKAWLIWMGIASLKIFPCYLPPNNLLALKICWGLKDTSSGESWNFDLTFLYRSWVALTWSNNWGWRWSLVVGTKSYFVWQLDPPDPPVLKVFTNLLLNFSEALVKPLSQVCLTWAGLSQLRKFALWSFPKIKAQFLMLLKILSEIKNYSLWKLYADFSISCFACFSKSVNRIDVKLVGRPVLSV